MTTKTISPIQARIDKAQLELEKKRIKNGKEIKPSNKQEKLEGRSKMSHGGVGIQTHGNKLASALNTQTPDHSVYLNEDGYLKGGIKVRS